MRCMFVLRFALALVVAGCATGFHRQALQQRLEGQPLEVSDEEIRAALEKKPQIRFPINLAVHLIADTVPSGNDVRLWGPTAGWRWSQVDVERIEQWAQSLRQAGIVSNMFVMSQLVSAGNDPRSVRLAGAKHGADAVLVIKGVAEVDRYVNPSAILNLLILPGYFVPASHRDALFMMRAAIWDVANEFLYLSVDAEGEARMKGPTFRIRDSDAIDSAKSLALESFGKEFLKRMHALKDAATERADSH